MIKPNWTIWFTGLHGSGKSTIANRLLEILKKREITVMLLDGDELRKTISLDLGYSKEERNQHMKRVADLCKTITDKGTIAIASVASPTEKSRAYAKSILKNMFLVYIKCPAEICEQRDVKGHYKKARMGEEGFENFLHTSDNYEEPKNADLILETDKYPIEKTVNKLFVKLKEKKIV
jgi:adenylylsulfate kinase